jgi:site-specific DNA recombinase
LASQESQLTAYCQMRGWTIINSYVDGGFTGKNGDRPGFKQLRSDARMGLFDKVLVTRLDRAARNLRLLLDFESELNEYHVSLTSIKESVDTSNGTGKMVFALIGSIGELERENIIERTRSGRIQRYREGCWACGKPPFGYSYDKVSRKLIINEDQAKIVRFIFDGYVSGKSLTSMNHILDDEMIPTIRGKKRGWIDAGIRCILINPAYKGILVVNRKCHITHINKVDMSKAIVIKVPPIVNESLWNLAQSHLESHKKIRPTRKNPWLLQGLVTCGICGLSFACQYNGPQKRCYACRGRLKVSHTDGSPRCVAPTLDADWLEDKVWTKIMDILNDPNELTKVIEDSLQILKAKQVELDYIIKPIDEKLAQIADKKARLADEFVLNNMALEKLRELQSYLNKEEMRLKSLRSNIHPARLIELQNVNETLQYWQNLFQEDSAATNNTGGGLRLLEKIKPKIGIADFEDTGSIECITSLTLKRQVLDKLQVKLVVFDDRIEIRCQIPYDTYKSINAIMTIGLSIS